ncbi:GNAT family N-acetyltransferase [Paenibacillus sp. N1-5-1-14]|uniref:GNAT family N-acetyltransferase n=1 Tax=Paenibacillus radicibacter TaxID=2972488 RepID=UPI002159656B|nr:N-acetyltransferase [Paenibacillus radicibacter]MCR8641049.1 GNAT family N-acetyltransferase [Paenibacillus radicibacter]
MTSNFYFETPDQLSPELLQTMIQLEKDVFGADGAVDEWGLVPIARYGRLVLMYAEGDPVPMAVCELMRDYQKPDKAYIYGYYVRNDYQGKGFGILLLDYVFEMLQEDNFSEVCLTVKPSNVSAVKLYMRAGFTVKERRAHEYGEGRERYYMVKKLK